MSEGIKRIESIIDEIEADITKDINCEALASKMLLSVYEFRRIFAFIVGCPISDYLRKRRMSLAACELVSNPKVSIAEISEKYGYSSESAFSKAFREHHGFSPNSCQKGGCEIKIFTRPEFEFKISGKSTVSFTVEKDDAFAVSGLTMASPYSDTCCCDAVWNEFYEKGYDKNITEGKIYAVYQSNGENVLCTIGKRGASECDSFSAYVPESKWATFKINTTDDETVNEKYKEIVFEILPSSGMKRRCDVPILEVFPRDMETEGFLWEIKISIE